MMHTAPKRKRPMERSSTPTPFGVAAPLATLFALSASLILPGCNAEPAAADEGHGSIVSRAGDGVDVGHTVDPDRKLDMRSKEERRDDPVLATSYVFHDGGEEKRLWVDKTCVIEFGPSATIAQAVQRIAPTAKEIATGQDTVRLWQVGTRESAPADFVSDLRAVATDASVSPAFRTSAGTGGPVCALSGGVRVELDPNLDEARMRAILANEGLEIERKLPLGNSMFVVKTPAGLESLRIAERLRTLDRVVEATPNLWQQVAKR